MVGAFAALFMASWMLFVSGVIDLYLCPSCPLWLWIVVSVAGGCFTARCSVGFVQELFAIRAHYLRRRPPQ